MHSSQRWQDFVSPMETLFWPNSQGLHSSSLDCFDARIGIFYSQAIWCRNLHRSRSIDEKIRRRFAIRHTIAICYSVEVAKNLQPLKHCITVFAAGCDSSFDACRSNLSQQVSAACYEIIWSHRLNHLSIITILAVHHHLNLLFGDLSSSQDIHQ